MAAIDKAAIAFTIAIVVVGAGAGFIGGSATNTAITSPIVITTPETTSMTTPTTIPEEPEPAKDPFADIAAKVREGNDGLPVVDRESESTSMMKEEEPAMMKEKEPAMTGPMTVSVSMPAGTSVPGCEETNECYIPESVTINVGDTVDWINDDTAAHTVTSGSPTEGPSGVFDSSLVMGGANFEFTFLDSGSYDYFCMVHPWMIGDVQVN